MSGTNDEEYLQELGANERIWRSATASASEKAAAWRRQLLLLEHLTREDTPANAYQLLQMHHAKLDTPEYQEYMQQRVQSVEKLLAGYQQNDAKVTAAVLADDLQLDESWFEAPCHGAYESCSSNEITADDLQWLRKDPVVDGPSTSGCNGQSHSPETGRSTIANYFQPLKQQLPPQVLSSAARHNGSKLENNNASDLAQLDNTAANHSSPFRTAREVLALQNLKKQNACTFSANPAGPSTAASAVTNSNAYFNYGITKKMLGGRRTIRSGFVLPVSAEGSSSPLRCNTIELQPSPPINSSPEVVDERLLNIDPKMIELIKNEIMHTYKAVGWDDVAGLDYAKSVIKEAVVYPLLRPDIFTGLRRPPRGILLFGPPGTGKTLIGKCIASQSQSTFFSISASSLTSKWVGDSEKMVRALFAVAAVHQPAVVFIDEVDSLLAKRSETEHDSSRKLKNEFLVQLDGAATSDEDRIVIVGATNRPQELDDAARRRFARRLYIPLPELEARIQILTQLLQTVSNNLNAQEIQEIGRLTEGYSGADMDILCREASMEPLRSIPPEQIPHIVKDKVRAVHKQDFQAALHSVRPSVSQDDLKQYITWNSVYGAVR